MPGIKLIKNPKPATNAPDLLAVGFLNVCSLRGKAGEIAEIIAKRGISIFAVAETWLKPSISDGELAINHFNLFRKDRINRHGGGVCLYCHETLNVRRRHDLESDSLEIMWLDVNIPGECIRFGCGYRPPNMLQAYWDDFEANVEAACLGTHATTVLVGDFNIDLRPPLASGALSMRNLLTRLGLQNYVTQPTRVTAHSETLIDLFLSSSPIHGVCESVYCDISDHNVVLARLSAAIPRQRNSTPQRKFRKFHTVNWQRFNEDLLEKLKDPPPQDMDCMVDSFTDHILSVLDQHAPLVLQRKRPRRPCPWLTEELVACVRSRNHLHRRLMRDRSNELLRQQHRDARSKARRLDRKLRNEYFFTQCSTTDQRKLWKVMNDVTGRKATRHDPQASMGDLSKQFSDVVTDKNRPSILDTPAGPVPEESLTNFQPVSTDDVCKCLQAVNPHKAVGSDHVPGVVLKSCARVLAEPLANIINASLSTGYVPLKFKISYVSPLFKSGDRTEAKNYRPVSLLPIVSRILEHFVKKQLNEYLSEQRLLPESQFAYRKHRSTEDAVTLAVNRWLMAKQERKYTGVIMVDMSKAFDRVRHSRLISILFSFGLCGPVLQWFCSYLSDRLQHIRIGDSLSAAAVCSRGVPQGSVLGPLLFLIYTSDIATVLPTSVVNQEFADDIIIDFSHSNPQIVCARLTTAMTNLSQWLEGIGLLMNAGKTQVMMLKPRGVYDAPCTVKCNDVLLNVTHTAKYLGVVIDDELSWQPHIDNISRKCAQAIGQLWRHGQCFTLRARKAWYLAIIQSSILYASNSFFPSLSRSLFSRLEKLSKAGLRAVFRVKPQTPTLPLMRRLKVRGLAQLCNEKLLVFVFRCMHNLSSALFHEFFSPMLCSDGQRISRGQVTHLLRVPFLPGPSGRSTVHFVATRLWNSLPRDTRSIDNYIAFRNEISAIDLSAYCT